MIHRLRNILPILIVGMLLAGTRFASVVHHGVEHRHEAGAALTASTHSDCCGHHHACAPSRHAERPAPTPDRPHRPAPDHHDCALCVMLATIAACATAPICLEVRSSPVVERVVLEQGLVGTVGPIDAPRGRGPPSCALDRA